MRYFNSIAINGNPVFKFALEYFGWDQEARARQEAEKYEFRVLEMIYKINATKTGGAVLRAVERVSTASPDVLSQKTMVIVPRVDAPLKDLKPGDKNYNPVDLSANLAVNAFATAEEPIAATHRGKVADYKTSKGVIDGEKIFGTGAGSNTTITFTPQHFIPNDINPVLDMDNPSAGFEPDEFLLHEIVHGLRQMSGLSYKLRVPFQKGYDDTEEFFAILIANIYRSECFRDKLRNDHGKDFINTTEGKFIRKGMNRSHLRQLRRQHHLLFSELREIDVAFNPTSRILDI